MIGSRPLMDHWWPEDKFQCCGGGQSLTGVGLRENMKSNYGIMLGGYLLSLHLYTVLIIKFSPFCSSRRIVFGTLLLQVNFNIHESTSTKENSFLYFYYWHYYRCSHFPPTLPNSTQPLPPQSLWPPPHCRLCLWAMYIHWKRILEFFLELHWNSTSAGWG